MAKRTNTKKSMIDWHEKLAKDELDGCKLARRREEREPPCGPVSQFTRNTEKDALPKKALSRPTSRVFLFFLACLLFFAILTGCKIEKTPSGLTFSHRHHLGRGFSCAVCHQFYTRDEVTWPSERICALCHEIGDHESPDMTCATCHNREDFSVKPPERESFGDNRFTHQVHLNSDISCQACHGDIGQAATYSEISVARMDDCLACHEKMEVDTDCSTCHEKIRLEQKPESHQLFWERNHGRRALEIYDTNCAYCHPNKVFCQGCHMSEPPKSHTLFFKNRGHGFWAETDRSGCLPCHQQDFCLRCHGPGGEVMPPNHKGGFLGRRPYLHCARCHFPAGAAVGCNTCHQAAIIQVKHLEATEMKSAPVPSFVPQVSLDCLNACHPFDRVFPGHPLGGQMSSDCVRCHSPEGGR